jgi:hypothetical protein
MSATPPGETPGIMSVAGLLSLIHINIGGGLTHAAAAAADLQGTHLLYDEDLLLGPTLVKMK